MMGNCRWFVMCVLVFGCGESPNQNRAPDNEAPVWPAGAAISTRGLETRIIVEWPEADDDGEITQYTVSLDEDEPVVLSGRVRRHVFERLAPATRYTVLVRGIDDAGSFTAQTLMATVVTTDETSPGWSNAEITLTEVRPAQLSIEWTAAFDNVGVTQYRVFLDDQLVQRTETDTRTAVIDGLQPGTSYTLRIEARDTAGLQSMDGPRLRVMTSDDSAPRWVDDATLSVVQRYDDALRLAWEPAIDNVAVARYRLTQDDEEPRTLAGDVTEFTVEGLTTDTEYSFKLTAIDAVGRESSDLEVTTRTRDTQPPVWSDDAVLSAEAISDTSVRLTWSTANDAGHLGSYVISQDLAEIATIDPSENEFLVEGLATDQAYTFRLYATDRVGNRSVGPLEVVVRTLDTDAPKWPAMAELDILGVGETQAQIKWPAAVDDAGVMTYRVDLDGITIYSGPIAQRIFDVVDLSPAKQYSVAVFAQDRVGQWSEPLNGV
ncbi:MAG: fibronectin type III domain-containing protein, partial [Myxococcota bacterium]|nr:fibronectin type III domain-containing protein [Myxococcota bacterium]